MSCPNSVGRAAPAPRTGSPAGAQDPMIPNHITHKCTFLASNLPADPSLCRRRDTFVGQVAFLFCSILPAAMSCISYTERLWGMGAS